MGKIKYLHILSLALFIALFIAGTLVGKSANQKVVVFDKGRLVAQFAKSLESHQSNEAKKTALIKQFSHAIAKGVTRFSKKNHAIIFPSNKAIIGAKDITDLIVTDIAYCMKKECVDG